MLSQKKIPDSVKKLIFEEQIRQNGDFIPNNSHYLDKLGSNAELLVHESPVGLLGYVFFYCNAANREVSYITLLGTSLQFRGKGVGYCMVQSVLVICKQRGFRVCQLEVRKNNRRALNFYTGIGFFTVEDRNEKYLMQINLR